MESRLKPIVDTVQIKLALKAALAAVASMAFTELLGLKQGYWAVITALLVMQGNIGGSLAASWTRLLGTTVGAVLGVACLGLIGNETASLAIAVALTVLACARIPAMREGSRLAAVTAAVIVMLGERDGGNFAQAARLGLDRFIEIVIGVALGLGVTFLVWPSRAKHGLAKGVAAVLGELVILYDTAFAAWREGRPHPPEFEALRKGLRLSRARNRTLLSEAAREPGGLSLPEQITVSLMNFEDRLFEDVLAMENAVTPVGPEALRHKMAEELAGLFEASIAQMHALAKDVEAGRAPTEPESLSQAMDLAERGLNTLRLTRATAAHELDEVMRFFSFYFSMRSLAEELLGMTERTRELAEAIETGK